MATTTTFAALVSKSHGVREEVIRTGGIVTGSRTVTDRMSWQADLPTPQERQDEKDRVFVCDRCWLVHRTAECE